MPAQSWLREAQLWQPANHRPRSAAAAPHVWRHASHRDSHCPALGATTAPCRAAGGAFSRRPSEPRPSPAAEGVLCRSTKSRLGFWETGRSRWIEARPAGSGGSTKVAGAGWFYTAATAAGERAWEANSTRRRQGKGGFTQPRRRTTAQSLAAASAAGPVRRYQLSACHARRAHLGRQAARARAGIGRRRLTRRAALAPPPLDHGVQQGSGGMWWPSSGRGRQM